MVLSLDQLVVLSLDSIPGTPHGHVAKVAVVNLQSLKEPPLCGGSSPAVQTRLQMATQLTSDLQFTIGRGRQAWQGPWQAGRHGFGVGHWRMAWGEGLGAWSGGVGLRGGHGRRAHPSLLSLVLPSLRHIDTGLPL